MNRRMSSLESSLRIFEVKETVYYVGTTYHTSRKTLITPKGQVYLAKKVSKGYKG